MDLELDGTLAEYPGGGEENEEPLKPELGSGGGNE